MSAPTIVRTEPRRLSSGYTRPSAMSEHELFEGYAVRLELLRGLDAAPASPYKPRGCVCHGDPRR